VADKGFAETPVFATVIWALDSIAIPRGGGSDAAETRQKAIDIIAERQELIEREGGYSPVVIFPEGGTSNGTHLMKFKLGAFKAEHRITPMFLKYPNKQTVSLAFEVVELLPLWFLHLSCFWYTVEVGIMPDFEPNEYLFTEHADKGTERWEIYAWAVRDAIHKAGSFESTDVPHRVKAQYENYMRRLPGAPQPSEIWADYQKSIGNHPSKLIQPIVGLGIEGRESIKEQLLPNLNGDDLEKA
jgi:hypothetical protein